MKVSDLVKCKRTGEIGILLEVVNSNWAGVKPALRILFTNTPESEWLFSHEVEVIDEKG